MRWMAVAVVLAVFACWPSHLLSTSAPQAAAPAASTAPAQTVFPDEASWQQLKVWYRQPAREWTEALPVGNGRLGAMVFGGTDEERLQLNEDTIWTGGPYDPAVDGAAGALAEVRRLVFAGRYMEAHELFGRRMMGKPIEQMKYQPLGNLILTLPSQGEVTEYRRDLDLDQAVTSVSYRRAGVRYRREVLASPVHQVIVVRLTADRPGQVSFSAALRGVRNTQHSNYGTDYFRMDGAPPDALVLTGRTSSFLEVQGRVHYEARLVAQAEGGSVEVEGARMKVTNADSVTLLLAAASNFVNHEDVSGDPHGRVEQVLRQVSGVSWERVRADHVAEHRRLFRRAALDLGTSDHAALPTDERVKRLTSLNDPHLAALYFQYGRYLMISSSRVGTRPANLQGIWNDNSNPWWDSKYTTNINFEMNYWPAEVTNLAECHEPLVEMTKALAGPGGRVAKAHYGARGWVLHQNTDIWLAAAPMDGPTWGTWPMGGAWLATHLWERYRYSGDREYLAGVYPVMKGSAEFLLDILVDHPEKKWLVTCPSNSPENFPERDGNVRYYDEVTGIFLPGTTICAGPAMDTQITRELFQAVMDAAVLLDTDAELRVKLASAIDRLAPMQVSRDGTLQEWLEDWQPKEPEHRHLSHLWGLYPGHQISLRATPSLAEAARRSLVQRGEGGMSFSMAWKVNLWARLLEGEAAHQILTRLIREFTFPNFFSRDGQALQVNGNLGGAAGITEMLMQSHDDEVRLLPALPNAWRALGRAAGLRARGGFEVDFDWNAGEVTRLVVRAGPGGALRVRSPNALQPASGTVRWTRDADAFVATVATKAGETLTWR
jgi:alpha-L-fucosidase 2